MGIYPLVFKHIYHQLLVHRIIIPRILHRDKGLKSSISRSFQHLLLQKVEHSLHTRLGVGQRNGRNSCCVLLQEKKNRFLKKKKEKKERQACSSTTTTSIYS